MDTRLTISLEDFPPTGLHLEGELDGKLFELNEGEIKSVGPLHYQLDIQLFDTELLATGTISAPFECCCARCLNQFTYTITCENISVSEDCTNKLAIDLTEQLREELVLILPNYPKCELAKLECEINTHFNDFRLDKDPLSGVQSATPNNNSVWDALDSYPQQ